MEAGVPETGRRLERMPVVVRRGRRDLGSVRGAPGSWGTGVNRTEGGMKKRGYLGVIGVLVVARYFDRDRL